MMGLSARSLLPVALVPRGHTALVGVLQGPRGGCGATGPGCLHPQARVRERMDRSGVSLLLLVAPGKCGGSARLTAGLDVTLKYLQTPPMCTLLNSTFLMPVANLRAPCRDSSCWHPVPPNPCGKEPLSLVWGHPTITPGPAPGKHSHPTQGKFPLGAAPPDSFCLLQKPPPRGFGSSFLAATTSPQHHTSG